MSSGGRVSFDEFLRHSEHQNISRKEFVGLTGYYLDEIRDVDSFDSKDIFETVKDSRESINSKHINTYLSRLEDDGYITKTSKGYRMKYLGLDHFGKMVDIPRATREVRHESFLELPDVGEEFYDTLINDINKCYRIGVDDATFVLTRKLFENLAIDLLRRKYGNSKEGVELFYNVNERRFNNFSTILKNLGENIQDFEYFSNRFDEELINDVDRFRESANSDAHSIEVEHDDDAMNEFSRVATNCAEVLIYVRRELEISQESS